MRNIAIVEDMDEQAARLESYLERYAKETGQELHCIRFRDGADFLEHYGSDCAVILMDIQMPNLNGMEAAVHLREKDRNVSILFVTNLVQYALRFEEEYSSILLCCSIAYAAQNLVYKLFLVFFTAIESTHWTDARGDSFDLIYHIVYYAFFALAARGYDTDGDAAFVGTYEQAAFDAATYAIPHGTGTSN